MMAALASLYRIVIINCSNQIGGSSVERILGIHRIARRNQG
jgi:hypothetical protein